MNITSIIEQEIKKVNAPTFIYKIAHGEFPKNFLTGRSTHDQRLVGGIMIDKGIPESAVTELNGMKGIEMRASCQGESKTKPAFIIFRLKAGDHEKVVKKLNKQKDITAGFDVGNGGKVRIGVTNKAIFEGKKSAEKWWLSLPGKIKKAL